MTKQTKKLVLADGREFPGICFGADGIAVGELIFNTSMVGYQEIFSDPSYEGKIIVMTYPLIGQYGIIDEDSESRNAHLAGLVVRDICSAPSNFRCTKTLAEEMEDKGVSCISGLDTRMLTKIIRSTPGIKAAIVPDYMPVAEAVSLIKAQMTDPRPAEKVSCTKCWYSRTPQHRFDVVVIDCGLKKSTVEALNRTGCNVTVVPFNTAAAEVRAFNPDAVLISSGPGDANAYPQLVDLVKELRGSLPLGGTGLGCQAIALSYGAKVVKLPCGRHGGAPMRNAESGRIVTVECNSDYAIDEASLEKCGLNISWTDVMDGSTQGITSVKDKVCAVQFCPEGGPGPDETGFFEKFVKMMED